MEINANISRVTVNEPIPAQRTAPSAPPATETDSFASSTALQNALNQAPDVRGEAVARGRALVSQDGYPPGHTVKKLSHFFARHLKGTVK